MKRKKLTLKKVISAIKNSGGVISIIAEKCKVDWHTVNNFIYAKGNEKALTAYECEKEEQLDQTETKLFDAIERGEPWAIALMLRTKGRKRGYGDEIKIDGNVTQKITFIDGLDD